MAPHSDLIEFEPHVRLAIQCLLAAAAVAFCVAILPWDTKR